MSKLMSLGVFGAVITALASGEQQVPAKLPHNTDELASHMRANLASSQKVVEA